MSDAFLLAFIATCLVAAAFCKAMSLYYARKAKRLTAEIERMNAEDKADGA